MTAILDGSLSRALASGNPWLVLDALHAMGLDVPVRGIALHELVQTCPDWHERHHRWLAQREFDREVRELLDA